MRLSDAVFSASDEFHISQLLPLYELLLKGGYGHISQPRFRCDIDNSEMSVIEMKVTALTPEGRLIDILFDHNERNLFQKIPMPESHDAFIVYLEQSTSEFESFEDKDIPYKSNRLSLIFKPEGVNYSNPDAVAVARFEYKQCWVMDNTFIPPCISVKANADLWNLGHSYLRQLSELSDALHSKSTSEMSLEVISLIPVISILSVEARKEIDEMSPKHLVTIMQQIIGAVCSAFQARLSDLIPEYGVCMEYIEKEYVSNRIGHFVEEGIRLTQILVQAIVALKQPSVETFSSPQQSPRPVRMPRTLDTSSERKSFKSRK